MAAIGSNMANGIDPKRIKSILSGDFFKNFEEVNKTEEEKKVVCSYCDSLISAGEKRCPHCGAPQKSSKK